jgi:hypothetical protein
MKNSDSFGNRNRDLPACTAVPQPTAPPRAPLIVVTHFLYFLRFFSKYPNGKRKSPYIRANTVILLQSLEWNRLVGQFQMGLRIISTAQSALFFWGGGGTDAYSIGVDKPEENRLLGIYSCREEYNTKTFCVQNIQISNKGPARSTKKTYHAAMTQQRNVTQSTQRPHTFASVCYSDPMCVIGIPCVL